MRLRDKRGMTLGDIYPAVLTIVLVGLILGIGIYVMSEVRENVYDANTLVTVSEETTLINESNNNIADTIGERDWA